MRIAQLEHGTVPEVRLGDTFQLIRELMFDARLFDLPVVDPSGLLQGIISFEQIQGQKSGKLTPSTKVVLNPFYMEEEDSIGRLLEQMRIQNMGCMPICDSSSHYRYSLTAMDLLHWIEGESMLVQPGAVMTMRMASHEYSPAELARIAESNRALILNLRMHDDIDSPGMCLVHLKFNLLDLSHLLSDYERYGLEIVYVSHETRRDEWLRDRYSSLMRYLEI